MTGKNSQLVLILNHGFLTRRVRSYIGVRRWNSQVVVIKV